MNKIFLVIAALFLFAGSALSPALAQSSSGSVAQSMSQSGNSNIFEAGERSASSAVAPGLAAAGVQMCAGSASGGVATPAFALSIGSTVTDNGCAVIRTAVIAYSRGDNTLGDQVMCQDSIYERARAELGRPCYAQANVRTQTVRSQTITQNGVTAQLVSINGQAVPSVPLRNAPRFYGVEQVMVRR